MQTAVVGALRNLSAVPEVRQGSAEEGIISMAHDMEGLVWLRLQISCSNSPSMFFPKRMNSENVADRLKLIDKPSEI